MIKRLLPLIPCLLLISIALPQKYYSTYSELSAWKGGGFGMFSTIDNRYLIVTVKDIHDQVHKVRIRGYMSHLVTNSLYYPSEDNLNKIIDKIKEMSNSEIQEQKPTTTNTDFAAQEMMLKEYANNSKKFYEHILSCEACRKKLAEIWKHLYE